MSRLESPATPTRVKGDRVRRLLLSNPLVLTPVPSGTGLGITFDQECSIDAVGALGTASVWRTATGLNFLLQHWPGNQVLVALWGEGGTPHGQMMVT